MDSVGGWQDDHREQVIETASATTSPDNARSGHMAYIIAAIAVGALALFGMGISGCMSLAADIVAEDFEEYHDSYIEEPYYDNDLDDLLNDWEDLDLENWDEDSNSLGGSYKPVDEVLSTDLGMYSATIDSLLSASSYANSQSDVSSYVRQIVLIDRDGTTQLANTLRNAAWIGEGVDEAIDEAKGQVDETIESLRDKGLPSLTGDHASDVSRDLEVGRSKAIERWKAIGEELDLLSQDSRVSVSAVLDLEDTAYQASEAAADSFSSALSTSANR